jgi:hypothetical protein
MGGGTAHNTPKQTSFSIIPNSRYIKKKQAAKKNILSMSPSLRPVVYEIYIIN